MSHSLAHTGILYSFTCLQGSTSTWHAPVIQNPLFAIKPKCRDVFACHIYTFDERAVWLSYAYGWACLGDLDGNAYWIWGDQSAPWHQSSKTPFTPDVNIHSGWFANKCTAKYRCKRFRIWRMLLPGVNSAVDFSLSLYITSILCAVYKCTRTLTKRQVIFNSSVERHTDTASYIVMRTFPKRRSGIQTQLSPSQKVGGSVALPSTSDGLALFPHLTDSLSGGKTEHQGWREREQENKEIAFDSLREVIFLVEPGGSITLGFKCLFVI